MQTNYEWLLHMDGEERQAWFDAEHVDSTRSAKRAAAVQRLRDYENWADGVDNCSLLKAVIGVDSWGIKWKENRDALIELLTDDDGLRNNDGVAAEHGATRMTNLERLFVDSEQFRQAVSAFAFAHSDDCPTSPTQMVDWLMAEHVDAQHDNNRTCPDGNETVSNSEDSRENLEADANMLADVFTSTYSNHSELFGKIIELLNRQAEITRKTEQAAWIQQANGLIHETNARADELQAKVDELSELNSYAWQEGFDKGCESRDDAIDGWRAENDRLTDELAKRDKGIARLKRQRDEARRELKKWEELTASIELPDYPFVQFQPKDKDRLIDMLTHERDALAADLQDCERQREQLRQALGTAIDHAHEVVSLVNLDGEVIG